SELDGIVRSHGPTPNELAGQLEDGLPRLDDVHLVEILCNVSRMRARLIHPEIPAASATKKSARHLDERESRRGPLDRASKQHGNRIGALLTNVALHKRARVEE